MTPPRRTITNLAAATISVITPAFNAASTILRAYRSLAAQTWGDWEYIVVDDGSTDDTPRLILALQDPKITHVIRTENRGTGAALNTGCDRASGNYLAFLDADDEFLPAHLATHLAMMESDPAIDLLWGGMEVVVNHESDAWIPDLDRGSGHIHASECAAQGTLFIRRRVFDHVRFTEDRSIWYQDYQFLQDVKALHFNCRRFQLPTYRYYRNSGRSLIDQVKAKAQTAAGNP